jgi:hypothetical protein
VEDDVTKKIRLKRITKTWAKRHGACSESVETFFKRFPDGLDLTDPVQVKRAWRLTDALDIAWFVEAAGSTHFFFCPCCHSAKERLAAAREAGLPL